ncbi:lipoma-preferred partner isoform X2 [Colossoma macropomum]|nr:lipoma-preferred partner isoform X2 [Colossoma macropomum]XP_036426255.1 lipoma-preferred partner isoform X2 [Colossoma macropomum]XP_036426256.1 lipoma-preferred partner isoform X2 [Colossoma macropomum]XP_036426258.1 lipoma-preferred partner isoform X2 [Colossoma macropomum]XP_036426259.1 lipoma-preferred partner isoform X2 [Colossoma macropomum]
MWSGQNDGDQHGHVTARMETSLPMGTTSISISQQQAPKKFAPVVAPKPKFNPYKQPGEGGHEGAGDYPPPPPPVMDTSGLPSPVSYLPPPPVDDSSFGFQIKGPEKTLEERRSSLDAEIDSLTSILADLESSSPYKPRTPQNSASAPATSPNAPVTGYKRMVIPTQPPLTATKKSTPKPQASPAPSPAAPPTARPQQQQPVPASYTTASTPSQPTFNVQVRAAQPGPQQQPGRSPAPVQYMPAQPRGPDFAYGPPQPGFNPAPAGGYQDLHYGGAPAYGGQNTWRAEPGHHAVPPHNQPYQPPAPKKTYITDPPSSLAPYGAGPGGPQKGPGQSTARPEEELDRLTKKMLYDMNHPPSEEYFGRCASCGENVVGEGTGCTAMDQVFHVDCFICMTCNCKLRGKPFYAVDKKAYCEPCYINTLETCTICSKPIMERILRATGKAYHPHCFTCVVCHRSLDGIPFTVDASNHIHCIEDFHKKFAPRCSVCNEPIMPAPGQEETVRIVALDRDFHVQCYRCEDCGCLLSEGDNQGCYPLDGHVLCKNCNTSRIQALTAKATTDL